jgi:hypothetical protein
VKGYPLDLAAAAINLRQMTATAILIALHIFGAVVWVGGMFAIYVCLRPGARQDRTDSAAAADAGHAWELLSLGVDRGPAAAHQASRLIAPPASVMAQRRRFRADRRPGGGKGAPAGSFKSSWYCSFERKTGTFTKSRMMAKAAAAVTVLASTRRRPETVGPSPLRARGAFAR